MVIRLASLAVTRLKN